MLLGLTTLLQTSACLSPSQKHKKKLLIMDSTWDIFHARSLKAKLCHQENHMRAHYPRSGKFPLVTVIALALQTVDKIQSKILSAYRFVVWS